MIFWNLFCSNWFKLCSYWLNLSNASTFVRNVWSIPIVFIEFCIVFILYLVNIVFSHHWNFSMPRKRKQSTIFCHQLNDIGNRTVSHVDRISFDELLQIVLDASPSTTCKFILLSHCIRNISLSTCRRNNTHYVDF